MAICILWKGLGGTGKACAAHQRGTVYSALERLEGAGIGPPTARSDSMTQANWSDDGSSSSRHFGRKGFRPARSPAPGRVTASRDRQGHRLAGGRAARRAATPALPRPPRPQHPQPRPAVAVVEEDPLQPRDGSHATVLTSATACAAGRSAIRRDRIPFLRPQPQQGSPYAKPCPQGYSRSRPPQRHKGGEG